MFSHRFHSDGASHLREEHANTRQENKGIHLITELVVVVHL